MRQLLPGQPCFYWQLQDRASRLWWGLDRPALEAHVARVNAELPPRADGLEPRPFRSSYPYGYEVRSVH